MAHDRIRLHETAPEREDAHAGHLGGDAGLVVIAIRTMFAAAERSEER